MTDLQMARRYPHAEPKRHLGLDHPPGPAVLAKVACNRTFIHLFRLVLRQAALEVRDFSSQPRGLVGGRLDLLIFRSERVLQRIEVFYGQTTSACGLSPIMRLLH